MLKTPLHNWHISNNAKMGEFAGYDMPLYYELGVLKEHQWCRSHAGIFDVSHMGQVFIEGQGAAEFFEMITPSNIRGLEIGHSRYTALTNQQGGIIDDLIVTRLNENKFFVVLNAGCKDKDIAWIKSHMPSGLNLYHAKDQALIALQGRWAERIIYEVFEYDATSMPYMSIIETTTPEGTPVMISRTGYTGEDGFEISLPDHIAEDIWSQLAGHAEAKPIGLAARDSLRLEMGYPLYGHDIDDSTSPVEADLKWIIRKENLDCIGAEHIKKALEQGVSRKRVGLKLLEKGIAREGAEILDANSNKVGVLTSGGFSPTLEESVGQGYVDISASRMGEKVFVNVRGRHIAAEIAKMPFVEAKTKSTKKKAA